MTPLVTVTICLHNSSRYIDDTIESLLAQTRTDFEAILIDDGSTDGTAERITTRFRDPRLTLIRQPNRGLGVTRSVAVSHARGEFVAFLDHDDLWLPLKLERQIAAAAAAPDAGLIFCDCLLIDAEGRTVGAMSERYDYSRIDLSAGTAHDELLVRGCFIPLSTVMARRDALARVGGNNPRYRYAGDYDLWLRLARLYRIAFVDQPLAKWRIHDTQFTQQHPEVAVAELAALWRPITRNRTYPASLRAIVADNLLGQRRVTIPLLLRQRRIAAAATMAASLASDPSALIRHMSARIRSVQARTLAHLPMNLLLLAQSMWRRAEGRPIAEIVAGIGDNRFARDRLPALLRTADVASATQRPSATSASDRPHVWIDGTPLTAMQTGYFNFVVETIRSFLRDRRGWVVHVTTRDAGRSVLRDRLGPEASSVRCHRAGRLLHRWRHPADITEIITWRGRFQFARSHKVAVIHDVTTRVHPELHTAPTIAEFDEFATYARRHAQLIATVSDHSRRDIIEHCDTRPASVRVVLSAVHPVYVTPEFGQSTPAGYGLTDPYVLCVGTIEPRKNLRRLVKAFEQLRHEGALRRHVLALAGPQGWDETFDEFLVGSDAYGQIRRLGFVPLEDMPSLYHFAAAVVYPSVYEGFGLPALEALCSSGVVLLSHATSLAEIAGDTVVTFDPFDTHSMAGAMRAAVTMESSEASAYRRRCRGRAEQLLLESPDRPSLVSLLCASPSRSHSCI